MSYRVRIIISKSEGDVLYDHSVEAADGYQAVPATLDSAIKAVLRHLLTIGAYGLARGGFHEDDDQVEP